MRSPTPGPWSHPPTSTPRQRAARAASNLATWSGSAPRLAALDARREQLTAEQQVCAQWDHDHAPQLRRALLAGHELAARHAARLTALERDPPAYIAAELGQRPAHPVAAHAWRRSVAAIERYRAATGIDDAERAWGSETANARQQIPFDQAVNEIATAWTEAEQPQDVERANDLTLDL